MAPNEDAINMTERQTIIEDAWGSYKEQCISAGASHTQVVESRRAFYAGASMIFTEIMIGLSVGDEPQNVDLSMLEDISTEIEEHASTLVNAAKDAR